MDGINRSKGQTGRQNGKSLLEGRRDKGVLQRDSEEPTATAAPEPRSTLEGGGQVTRKVDTILARSGNSEGG